MSIITKTGAQSDADPFTFVLSDGTVDRMGDVVEPTGWDLQAFQANPVALYGHDQANVIGTWKDVRVEGGKLMGTLALAAEGTVRLADEVRSLIGQRILRAVSVGFRPISREPIVKDGGDFTGTRYTAAELVEASVVAVPANANALSIAKALQGKLTKNGGFSLSAKETKKLVKNDTFSPPASPALPQKERAMRLAEKIQISEERLAAVRDELSRLIEGEEPDTDTVDALSEEADALDKQLASWKAAEKVLVGKAARDPIKRPTGVPAAPETSKPGDLITRCAVATAISMIKKKDVETVARELYGDTGRDPRVASVIRSATEPADTAATGWAAELMQTETRSFIDDLADDSVMQRLASLGTSISFGTAQTVRLPRRADGTRHLSGSFVGEGRPIPVKQGVLRNVVLERKKVAVITAFTRELFQNTAGEIERICREMIVNDTAAVLDSVLLDAAAGTVIRPASVLHTSYSPNTAASGGNTFADIVDDLKTAFAAITTAGGGGNLVVMMNPIRAVGLQMVVTGDVLPFRDEVAQGRILGATLVQSAHVPTDQVIVVDADYFVSAYADPTFDTSTEATLVLLNDDGTDPFIDATAADPAAGVGRVSGAATITGGPARVSSLWQEDSIALRMHLPVTWAMTKNSVVSTITGVGW